MVELSVHEAECKRLILVIYKTVQEIVPARAMEYKALIYMVSGIRNRHNMAGGFSVNQRVFGAVKMDSRLTDLSKPAECFDL
eukprot:6457643-Amphidinium_carterae.2